MGIREGRFIPAVGYGSFEALFQELSAITFEEGYPHLGPQTAEEATRVEIRKAELKSRIGNFAIRLQKANGEHIPTAFIDVVDFAPDLGDDGREIRICVEDWEVYVQFFGQQL